MKRALCTAAVLGSMIGIAFTGLHRHAADPADGAEPSDQHLGSAQEAPEVLDVRGTTQPAARSTHVLSVARPKAEPVARPEQSRERGRLDELEEVLEAGEADPARAGMLRGEIAARLAAD